MSGLIDYLKNTREELKHVSWPTRQQSIIFTIAVIVISILVSLFLGFFDYIFSLVIQKFIL